MAPEYAFDPKNRRYTTEKSNVTVSAGKKDEIFFEDNEDGWVQEVLIKCNSNDVTLEISLGGDIDKLKISDAYDWGLLYPNVSFWIPYYDTSNNIFVIAYHPFNPQPYKGSVAVSIENHSSSSLTVTKVIFKRIVLGRVRTRPERTEAGSEFPPYGVHLPKKKK